MKKILLGITVLASLHMKAKDIGMPFEQGIVWSYYTAYNFVYSPLRYKADGEKVINNRIYTAIYQFDGCEYSASEATLAGCIRQEDNKIYMAAGVGEECLFAAMDAKEENGEYLLYDFALKEGDKFGPSGKQVTEVSSLTNAQGETLKTITLENGIVWVEGIGATNRLFFRPLSDERTCTGCVDGLLNVALDANEEVFYRTSPITYRPDCWDKSGNAISNSAISVPNIFVTKEHIGCTFPSAGICLMQLYDNEGRLCLSQRIDREATTCSLPAETLPKGTYLLIATRTDGSRQSFKVVR